MNDSVILVETKFFFLQWVFFFCKPRISIDGGPPQPGPWGRHPFTVAPGQHRVEVFVPYLFFTRMGANSVTVDARPGDVAHVTWKAPWLAIMPGSIKAIYQQGAAASFAGAPGVGASPQTAAPASAAGWFPDPTTRHEHRYYDGAAWTPQVSDGGVAGTDPV